MNDFATDRLTKAIHTHQTGHLDEAGRLYREVLSDVPHHAGALHLFGVVAFQAGRLTLAGLLIGRALSVQAASAPYHSNLALVLRAEARLTEALTSCRRALVLRPDFRDGFNNLGQILQDLGQGDQAKACFSAALTIDPRYPEPYNNLGNESRDRGDLGTARLQYGQALALRPDYAEAHSNLAVVLTLGGLLAEASASARKAAVLRPDYPEAFNNLGNTVRDQGVLDEARACFTRALHLKPGYSDALNNLGNAYKDQGRLEEALKCFRDALELQQDDPESLNNLGGALMARGQLDQALDIFGKAVSGKSAALGVISNLIMAMHYSDRHDSADILAAARIFNRAVTHAAHPPQFRNNRDWRRRLRVGYVSADFKAHPVSFFLIGSLEARNGEAVEVTCYSNSALSDSMTERLKRASDRWRSIVGLSDREAALMIAKDKIDILVDLSGHTGDNRLSLFALRPAPVQVTWLGYFGTTGLSAIDYIIADDVVLPVQDEVWYSETPWRLPDCYLNYRPHALDIPPGPFPGLSAGRVTFGCFNNGAKITLSTIACWATLLHRVEGARLLLKTRSLGDPQSQALLREKFAARDIGPDRLIFEGHSPLGEALESYNKIDIALDPFPFGGCTTTAETLWMGVPVVSLRGGRWSGRMSETILTRLGLRDWVARDPGHYIDIAAEATARLPALADLRLGLRSRLEQSSFCDSVGFAAGLEAAYRGMWRAWCEGVPVS